MPCQLFAKQNLVVVAGVIFIDTFFAGAGFFDSAEYCPATAPSPGTGTEPPAVGELVLAAERLEDIERPPRHFMRAEHQRLARHQLVRLEAFAVKLETQIFALNRLEQCGNVFG